jgi:RNA 3'-terminal phosphate cyclase (ATP)
MQALKIDGSFGEGGGQILRTSLTLSAVTNTPFQIFNIRAKRKPPGLRPQHLQAVTALAKICGAEVDGAQVGSLSITFKPAKITPGDYLFQIGTAGSVSLVLQTLFLPLALAATPTRIEIHGGTHVPFSPCFHYLKLQWLTYLKALGLEAELEMPKAGFYPRGGGEIIATISPKKEIRPLILEERGKLKIVRGISAVGNLPPSIALRQKEQAERRLSQEGLPCHIELEDMPATAKGTMLLLIGEFERSQCCYYGLGAIGKRAETVADEACDQLLNFLKTDGVVDEHLADQLVLPLALSKGTSSLVIPRLTQHLLTNIEVIKKFISVKIDVEDRGERGGVVRIQKL